MTTNGTVETGEKTDVASTQMLIDLLEFEIDRLEEGRKQPGFTLWALVAAIATLLWAGLSVLESAQHISMSVVGFLFLTLNAAFDDLRSLWALLTADASSTSQSRFRLSTDMLGQSRPRLLFREIRFGFSLILLTQVVNSVHPTATICLKFYYGLGAIAVVAGIIFSFLPIAMPAKNALSKRAVVAGFVFTSILTVGMVGLVVPLSKGYVVPTVLEWKLAAIATAIILALDLLLSGGKDNPLFETLIDLRRKLATREIGYAAARAQFEVAIGGMAAGSVLQRRVESVLRGARAALAHLSTAATELETLKNQYGRMPANDRNTFGEALVKSASTRVDEARSEATASAAALRRLMIPVGILAGMAPGSKPEVMEIFSQAKAAVENVQTKVESQMLDIEDMHKWLGEQTRGGSES
jgi:hypothetical protein